MQNIGQGVIKNLWISMPAVPEQEMIVAQILEDTQPLNTAVARAEHEIELLQEYRTRLVADVVTGKLDVRGSARDLPAQVDDPQPSSSDESEEAELIAEEQIA